jgi:predicted metal-binding membrane protein
VVWTSFGAAAFLADLGVHRLVERSAWLATRPALIGGAVLLLAGAFQFSKLKDRCLAVCRHPAGYLLQHYRRGTGAAFRLGAGHGVFCVGCCWALMLVAFAAGVANLWWMAALTAVMVFEKTGRGGRRGVRPIGLGLIVLGLLMLAFAVTGGTGEFKKARGQMHETFLPTGEFRFAFTLYLYL